MTTYAGFTADDIASAFAYICKSAFVCKHCGAFFDEPVLRVKDMPVCPDCNSSNLEFDEDMVYNVTKEYVNRKNKQSIYSDAMCDRKADLESR